eukprot:GHVH01000679.1.p1 GENE.GHVH01000679.1~~GHVH01000679.1.p1  ORF type:complete len:448 (+),score=39.40 GHVH01000679.1:174-1517(+)
MRVITAAFLFSTDRPIEVVLNPDQTSLFIPFEGIEVSQEHDDNSISLGALIPRFSIAHATFPTVWTDLLDEELLSGSRGLHFWRNHILPYEERPSIASDTNNVDLLTFDSSNERELHLAAFLSCVAVVSDSTETTCEEALADSSRRVCGARYISRGGGVGARYGRKWMFPLSDWAQGYLLWDNIRGISPAADRVRGTSFCYGMRHPSDIAEWAPYLDNPVQSRKRHQSSADDLRLMSKSFATASMDNSVNGNSGGNFTALDSSLWSSWLNAWRHNREIMANLTVPAEDTLFTFERVIPEPIALTYVEYIHDRMPISRIKSLNRRSFRSPANSELIDSSETRIRSDVDDASSVVPLRFKSTIHQWIEHGWRFDLSMVVNNPRPGFENASHVVVKPHLSVSKSPCQSLMMSDAVAVSRPLPGYPLEGDDRQFIFSLRSIRTSQFVARWS